MTKKHKGIIIHMNGVANHFATAVSDFSSGFFIEPIDEDGYKALEKWRPDGIWDKEKDGYILFEKENKRSQRQNRMYWALIDLVLNNQDFFQSKEHLSHYIKLKTGHVDLLKYKGEVIEVPKSISFSSTKQEEFNSFIDKAIDFIISDEGLWPGLDKDTVLNEVYDIIGASYN